MAKDLKQEYFNKLVARLTKLFLMKEDAIVIAGQATLNLGEIAFDNRAVNTWDSVLSRAEIEDKIEVLLKSAIANNNGDDDLSSILQDVNSGVAFVPPPPLDHLVEYIQPVSQTPQLLLIYHNNDEERCKKLKKFFAIFVANGELIIKDFQTGITEGEIQPQRQALLKRSCIVMPVISPDFFDPEEELMSFVRNSIEAKKKLVPALLVNCPYSRIKVLKDYVALPPQDKFINDYQNEEQGYNAIAKGLIPVIEKCNQK